MRTCFAASVVLLLSASVAAEAPNPKRVTRLVAATLALLPRTSKVLTTVFTEVSPADCPGARKTFNKVLQFSAEGQEAPRRTRGGHGSSQRGRQEVRRRAPHE